MNYWVIAGIPATKRTDNIDYIVDNVCKVFEVSRTQLRSKRRFRHIIDARSTLCYILHKKKNKSSVFVSKYLNLNHTTILHHCKNVEGLIETDKDFKKKLDKLI